MPKPRPPRPRPQHLPIRLRRPRPFKRPESSTLGAPITTRATTGHRAAARARRARTTRNTAVDAMMPTVQGAPVARMQGGAQHLHRPPPRQQPSLTWRRRPRTLRLRARKRLTAARTRPSCATRPRPVPLAPRREKPRLHNRMVMRSRMHLMTCMMLLCCCDLASSKVATFSPTGNKMRMLLACACCAPFTRTQQECGARAPM